MILIDDIKYSCIECIRGHRSSLCRHHTRPLLQVRSKGRPNIHANGNPNHRIAVFAEEIDHNNPSTTGYKNVKCENKRSPVVILKASPKQVVDLKNGQVIGPYQEDIALDESSKPPLPIINSNSFINTSSCCLNGINKPKKSCGCCSNKINKNINKLKILKTYLEKYIKPEDECKFIEYSKNIQIKKDNGDNNINHKHSVYIDDEEDNSSKSINDDKLYDVVKIPSCSIPGSCSCDNNCSCEGCFTHGNVSMNKLNNNQFSNLMNYANKNDIKMPNEIMSKYTAQLNNITNDISDNVLSGNINTDGHVHSVFANDLMEAENSTQNVDTMHPQLNSIYTTEMPASNSNIASNNVINQTQNHDMNFLNGPMYDLQTNLHQEEAINQQDKKTQAVTQGQSPAEQDIEYRGVCSCTNDCDCFNCETHGIINGMKLDDWFNSVMPMGYKDIIDSIGIDRDDTNITNLPTTVPNFNSSGDNRSTPIVSLSIGSIIGKTSGCCKK